jgi:flagellar FliL protein
MADEKPAPPAEGGEITPPPKASNPMIPLAIVLVAMPAISFAMVKFVLVPQIQKAASGGAPAAAGAHGAGAAHGAEPAKDAKKDDHGGGHGKDDKGGKDAKDGKKSASARSKDGWEYNFPNVISNLTGSMGTRYLRCSFTVVSDDEHIGEMMEENKSKLKDAALRIFAARSQSDLESVSARNVIRTEIAATFNKALETAAVKEVLFTDFIVQ